MATPVNTVAAGGIAVVDVTATLPKMGAPVSEALPGKGIAVTKVAALGVPVTFVADVGGGGAPAWEPDDLGAALKSWWKADAGVTLSGANATAVVDQSGNGKTLVNVGVVPFNATGLNGRPAFDFVAVNNAGLKATGYTVLGTSGAGSAFIVGQMKAGTATNGGAVSYSADANNFQDYNLPGAAIWMARDGANNAIGSMRNSIALAKSTVPMATNFRFGSIFDGVNNITYLNNVAGTPVAFAAPWSSTGVCLLVVGSRATSNNVTPGACWDGLIAEVVITNTALSLAERNSLDDYFTGKYGI